MVDNRIHVARADLISLDVDYVDFGDLQESLEEAAEASTAITILGGYYNSDWLISLCRHVPKKKRAKCDIRVAVGLDAVALLPQTWSDMRYVNTKLVKLGFQKVTLAVVTSTPVHFHTKLFYFRKTTRPIWFVGSANPGSKRHELMVRFAGRHEALSAYIDAVFASAQVVDSSTPPVMAITTLRDFFLTGELIHKSPQARTYSFDAFKFNADDREKLMRVLSSNAGVEHARPTTSGFAFSLRSAMGQDAEIIDDGLPEQQDGLRTNWRTYSADTVFGHWLPRKYARQIHNRVEEATEQRQKGLQAFGAALDAPGGIERANAAFDLHLTSMRAFLNQHNISAVPVSNQESSFKRFLDSRHKLLTDQVSVAREARSIVIERMPDIYNDLRAVKAFEMSFFEDIAYRAGQSGAGRGRIVKSLEQVLGVISDSPEDLQEALEKHLAIDHWVEDNWTD